MNWKKQNCKKFNPKNSKIFMLFPNLYKGITFEPVDGFWCFWCLTGGFQGCRIQFWGFWPSWVTPYVQAHSLMVYRKSAAPYNFWFLLSWILVQSNLISVLPNFTMYIDELVRTFHLRLSIELPWRGIKFIKSYYDIWYLILLSSGPRPALSGQNFGPLKTRFKSAQIMALEQTLKLVFHPPHPTHPTMKLLLTEMDTRAYSKTFLLMGNFFITQSIKRYSPF